VAVKSNLLYDATATFNIGGEYAINKTFSVNLSANYNGWALKAPYAWKHYMVQPEFRYWLRETFNEHYVGAHLVYGGFDIERMSLPFFGFKRRNLFVDGTAYGAGVAYGYQLYITPHLNVEFSLGVGFLQLKYYKFDYTTGIKDLGEISKAGYYHSVNGLYYNKNAKDGDGKALNPWQKSYIGPTQIGITIVYIIN
jgi:hypothetical protein